MKPLPKWLIVPPIAALLLVLGPLTMRGSKTAVRSEPASPAASAAGPREESKASRGPTLPDTPDFWQIGSALLGVLMLGGVGLYGLRRLRGGAVPTRGTNLLVLRQTLRLSARQAVHAVEFDDRILVLGESERGLTMLDSGKSPTLSADEADAVSRAAELLSSTPVEEDGAVPKDMLIPRPAGGPRRTAPRQPSTPRAEARHKTLNDFRALLQKAGRA